MSATRPSRSPAFDRLTARARETAVELNARGLAATGMQCLNQQQLIVPPQPGWRPWRRRTPRPELPQPVYDASGWLVVRQDRYEDEYFHDAAHRQLRQRLTTFVEIWLTTDGRLRLAEGQSMFDAHNPQPPVVARRTWGAFVSSPVQIEDKIWTARTIRGKMRRPNAGPGLVREGEYHPHGPKQQPANYIRAALESL